MSSVMRDVDDIRRKAMRVLEDEAGGPILAAKKAKMSHVQWINLRNAARDTKTGKPRGMRASTARRIELAFGKPRNWMDHADIVDPNFETDNSFTEVIHAWQVAAAHERDIPLAWAKSVLSAHRRSKRK